jgi:hypothetical protein
MQDPVAISIIATLAIALMLFIIFKSRKTNASTTNISFAIEKIKEVGELSVLKAYVKEIVTVSDDAGWHSSNSKMALICSFEIEFRYDLNKAKIEKINEGQAYRIVLPPHFPKIIPDRIEFYHEEKKKTLGLFGRDFSVEDRNKMISKAREEAVKQAEALHNSLVGSVQNSAKTTLAAIANAFDVTNIEYEFIKHNSITEAFRDEMQNLREGTE